MKEFIKIKKKNGDTLTTAYPIINFLKSKLCDEHEHTVFRYHVTLYDGVDDAIVLEVTKHEYNRLIKLHAKEE